MMREITRRDFIRSTVAAIAGATTMGPAAFAARKNIKIGVLAPSHCALPVIWAHHNKIFRKFNLKAEVVFSGSMSDLLKGLCRGGLDAAQLIAPIPLAVRAGNPGFSAVPLAITQILGTNGGVLAISTRHRIKKLAELKGKTIGVHSPWMVHYFILNMILSRYGLEPGKNVKIITIPFRQMAQSIKEGKIDAIIHPEPLPSLLEQKGICKTLFITRLFWKDHPCCCLTVRQDRLDKEKHLFKDLTLATTLAGLELNHPVMRNKAIKKIHSDIQIYSTIPLPVLIKGFASGRSDFYPFPFRSSGILLAKQMRHQGALPPGIEVEQLVHRTLKSELALEILQELAKEVPGTAIPAGLDRQERIFGL